MSRKSKVTTLVIFLVAGAAAAVWGVRHVRNRTTTLRGDVITANPDPRKQLPVGGVEITATDGISVVKTTSDSCGLLAIALRKRIFRGHLVKQRVPQLDNAQREMSVLACDKSHDPLMR